VASSFRDDSERPLEPSSPIPMIGIFSDFVVTAHQHQPELLPAALEMEVAILCHPEHPQQSLGERAMGAQKSPSKWTGLIL
jgi:hypothetical protein